MSRWVSKVILAGEGIWIMLINFSKVEPAATSLFEVLKLKNETLVSLYITFK